jgi:hypothetical protein
MKLVATGMPASLAVTQYKTKAAMLEAYTNKNIDVSWASNFAFYSALTEFFSA